MNRVKTNTIFAALVTALLVLCVNRAHCQNCNAHFEYTVGANDTVKFTNVSTGTNATHFLWEFGDGDFSNQPNPAHRYKHPGLYLVKLSIGSQNPLCSDTVTRRVCVRCVYPGDANRDGIVNNNDVLYVGLAYNATGPVRPDTLNGGPNFPWLQSNGLATLASGVNIQNADCNGDGIINNDDLAVILSNYNSRTPKSSIAECMDVNDIPLCFVVPDSIQVGDTVSVEVHLGDNQIPAEDVYGIAFAVNYDNELIQPGTLSFDYGNSLFGDSIIFLDKDITAQSRIETAVTGIDHDAQYITGHIGTLNFVMEENLAQKTYLTAILNLSFADITLIKPDETTLPVCACIDSAVVFEKLTSGGGPQPEKRISLYPNPANDFLKIDLPASGHYEIAVMNVLGKQLIRESSNGASYTLNTSLFPKGTYFLSLRNGDSLQTLKFEVWR